MLEKILFLREFFLDFREGELICKVGNEPALFGVLAESALERLLSEFVRRGNFTIEFFGLSPLR